MPKRKRNPPPRKEPPVDPPPVEVDLGLLFPVGKVVGFQGLDGSMKVKPNSNNPALLLDVQTVQIAHPDGKIQDFTVKEIFLERRMLFVKFWGFDDRTSVEHFMDCHISTTRQQLRELAENEWWADDLRGLQVYTTAGTHVGTVSDIIGSGAELLEITKLDGQGKEPVLVPFVEALVPLVDISAGRIEVVDLPGLLDPDSSS